MNVDVDDERGLMCVLSSVIKRCNDGKKGTKPFGGKKRRFVALHLRLHANVRPVVSHELEVQSRLGRARNETERAHTRSQEGNEKR